MQSALSRSSLGASSLLPVSLDRFGGPDPLSAFDDDFSEGPADPLARGWSLYDPYGVAVSAVNAPYLNFRPTVGSTGGSLWFDSYVGILLYKQITGPFQAYSRIEVLNAAGTGPPSYVDFSIGAIAAHDGARPPNNYVHKGCGAGNLGTPQAEPKTTDDGVSTYSYDPLSSLFIDVSIRRYATDLQLFDLRHREVSASIPLLSDVGFTTDVVSRLDRNVPPRASAIPLPLTLDVGYVCYSSVVACDISVRSSAWHVRHFGG